MTVLRGVLPVALLLAAGLAQAETFRIELGSLAAGLCDRVELLNVGNAHTRHAEARNTVFAVVDLATVQAKRIETLSECTALATAKTSLSNLIQAPDQNLATFQEHLQGCLGLRRLNGVHLRALQVVGEQHCLWPAQPVVAGRLITH